MSFFERIKEIMGEEEAAVKAQADPQTAPADSSEIDLSDPTSVTTIVTQEKELSAVSPVAVHVVPEANEAVETSEQSESRDSDYVVPFYRNPEPERPISEVSEPGLFDDLTDMAKAVAESPVVKVEPHEPEKSSLADQQAALTSVDEMKKSIEMKDRRIQELEGLLNDLNIRNDQLEEANEQLRCQLQTIVCQIKELRSKLAV